MDPRFDRRRVEAIRKRLSKKTKKGAVGYPVGTLAFYGPDDKRASKLVVGIFLRDGSESDHMRKWFDEAGDARRNLQILEEAVAFLEEHGARSVAMADRIIGCPHEEGVDYEGPVCPRCPFWAGRNRWTGEPEGGD